MSDVITLTQDQLDEAIKAAVAAEVGRIAPPSATVSPTVPGQMVTQRKRKIPPHMSQPRFQPESKVTLTEDSEKNWTWRRLEEFDEVPEDATTMKRRQNGRIVTYVREESALKGVVATVVDLPQHITRENEWKVPVEFPNAGIDQCRESELVPSYS